MSPYLLVEELGQQLGVSLKLDSDGLARLMVDGHMPIDFEYNEADARLFVCGMLGIAPAGPEREQLLADLLAADLFGHAMGRCTPALDVERGELLLWTELDTNADTEAALAALQELVERTEHWRARLAHGATGSSPQAESLLAFGPPEGSRLV